MNHCLNISTWSHNLKLPSLKIGNVVRPVPIVQGGMGVGVSRVPMARAVSACGGLGTLSSAALDRLVSLDSGRKVDSREAAAIEVENARAGGDPIAINIMVALDTTYEASVLGALDAGVEVIVSGAGLPLRLPQLVNYHPRGQDTALVPIVSSARALKLVTKRWSKAGRPPDGVVLEGPLAGGHLGWKTQAEINDPANSLERLLEEVLETSKVLGDIPVIVAGGIYARDDVERFIGLGAAGVQLGTRFLATEESTATEEYKQAVVACTEADVEVAIQPGSPCGLPFRVLKDAPMYVETKTGNAVVKCNRGYVLIRGSCLANQEANKYFCICNGLLASCGYGGEGELPLYTVGSNAARVDKVLTVAELMEELTGKPCG